MLLAQQISAGQQALAQFLDQSKIDEPHHQDQIVIAVEVERPIEVMLDPVDLDSLLVGALPRLFESNRRNIDRIDTKSATRQEDSVAPGAAGDIERLADGDFGQPVGHQVNRIVLAITVLGVALIPLVTVDNAHSD